mmetsp:Transcript_128946/g.345846  ORF Transcript_128946/g.345846 Transcript_128946/m.345846 type:complete len:230 (+) Transcript_128946:733-1422(+)
MARSSSLSSATPLERRRESTTRSAGASRTFSRASTRSSSTSWRSPPSRRRKTCAGTGSWPKSTSSTAWWNRIGSSAAGATARSSAKTRTSTATRYSSWTTLPARCWNWSAASRTQSKQAWGSWPWRRWRKLLALASSAIWCAWASRRHPAWNSSFLRTTRTSSRPTTRRRSRRSSARSCAGSSASRRRGGCRGAPSPSTSRASTSPWRSTARARSSRRSAAAWSRASPC